MSTTRFGGLVQVARTESGSVVIIAVIVLLLLALTGLYSANLGTIESRIAANTKSGTQAFYAAQAGIEEARVRLPTLTQTGTATPTWRAFIGTADSAASLFGYDSTDSDHAITSSTQSTLRYTIQVRHKTEADHGDDLNGDGDTTDIIYWGDADADGIFEQNTTSGKPIEVITSVGEVGKATDKVTVEVCRGALDLKYAVYGDGSLITKDDGTIWKGASDPPYLAGIGSNENIEINDKTSLYGDLDIGKSESGTQGTYANQGGTIWGNGPNYIDRIDPDPLKLLLPKSPLDLEFARFSSSNDNLNGALPAITDNAIHLEASETMTLMPGHYYLTSMLVDADSILTVDVTSGPVTIYLAGSLEAKTRSAINVIPASAPPGRFTIHCRAKDGSTSPSIEIGTATPFKGVIYAPEAHISLHNAGDVHGLIWGRSVDIKNNGAVIFDPRLKSQFLSPKYTARCWKEER